MNINFRAADVRSSAALDFAMGETLTYLPRIPGGYTTASRPDPERPERTLRGVLGGGFASQDTDGDKRGGSFRGGRMATRDRSASFDMSLFPDKAGYPRKGDQIRQEATGTVYDITADAFSDGMNRLFCNLVYAS